MSSCLVRNHEDIDNKTELFFSSTSLTHVV